MGLVANLDQPVVANVNLLAVPRLYACVSRPPPPPSCSHEIVRDRDSPSLKLVERKARRKKRREKGNGEVF